MHGCNIVGEADDKYVIKKAGGNRPWWTFTSCLVIALCM